jgi:transposase
MINGLVAIVEGEMVKNPMGGSLFVFTSRRRNTIRLLYWDKSGFALWTKKLETERFKWPAKMDGETIELSTQQLCFLLDGYDLARMKPHATLQFSVAS